MRNPLHSICPYFAMFPEEFVREYLEKYTSVGNVIFDCFSGRGKVARIRFFVADTLLRSTSIRSPNCISAAKAEIPAYDDLHERIDDLEYFFPSDTACRARC